MQETNESSPDYRSKQRHRLRGRTPDREELAGQYLPPRAMKNSGRQAVARLQAEGLKVQFVHN